MSIIAQPTTTPSAGSSKSVTLATLILSLALAASVTAAIIFAVLYFRQSTPAAGGANGPNPVAAAADETLALKGTVSPGSHFTDIVYYETPFASPPHLTLARGKRQYTLVSQDETSFTWAAQIILDDLTDEARKTAGQWLSLTLDKVTPTMVVNGSPPFKSVQLEDFIWEARGVRAAKGAVVMKTFPQDGTFNAVAGQEGEVAFPIPYATAPNVELSSAFANFGVPAGVFIVESRPTGFKWKNVSKGLENDSRTLVWKAKGIRATEIPKSKPE
jgi:hypothetical protein